MCVNFYCIKVNIKHLYAAVIAYQLSSFNNKRSLFKTTLKFSKKEAHCS